jgi:hypothetical protein
LLSLGKAVLGLWAKNKKPVQKPTYFTFSKAVVQLPPVLGAELS